MASETVRSALVVAAHPDDCEYHVGGTVAGWAAAGAAVDLVVLTDGGLGSHDPHLRRERIVAMRRAEQACGAERLGLRRVVHLDAVDGGLTLSEHLVAKVAEEIRRARPEVVVGHDPWARYELHPDHRVAGEILWRAAFEAGEPRLGAAAWRPARLLLFGTDSADRFENVAATIDRKIDALLCHRSQFTSSFGIGEDSNGDRLSFRRRLEDIGSATDPSGRGIPHEAFKEVVVKAL